MKKSIKKKSDEQIGKEAADVAHSEILKLCDQIGLSKNKVLTRINEGLDANENKVFYDKDRGKCITGPDQINWNARQKAVDQAVSIWGMKAPEKLDVNVTGDIGDKLNAARERVKNASRKKN